MNTIDKVNVTFDNPKTIKKIQARSKKSEIIDTYSFLDWQIKFCFEGPTWRPNFFRCVIVFHVRGIESSVLIRCQSQLVRSINLYDAKPSSTPCTHVRKSPSLPITQIFSNRFRNSCQKLSETPLNWSRGYTISLWLNRSASKASPSADWATAIQISVASSIAIPLGFDGHISGQRMYRLRYFNKPSSVFNPARSSPSRGVKPWPIAVMRKRLISWKVTNPSPSLQESVYEMGKIERELDSDVPQLVLSEPIDVIESTETNPSRSSNNCSALGMASGFFSISSTSNVRSAYPLRINMSIQQRYGRSYLVL